MSNTKEHWLKNPWVVTPVFILLTPPITALWDLIKGIPFLTTLKLSWHWFVNCELKLWWIILYILLTSLISTTRQYYKNKKFSNDNYRAQSYLRFTAVKYGNFKWKWTYIKDNLTKLVEVDDLLPVCPNKECDNNTLSLINPMPNDQRIHYNGARICNKCNAIHYVEKSEYEVLRHILDKIDANTFNETTDILPDFVINS